MRVKTGTKILGLVVVAGMICGIFGGLTGGTAESGSKGTAHNIAGYLMNPDETMGSFSPGPGDYARLRMWLTKSDTYNESGQNLIQEVANLDDCVPATAPATWTAVDVGSAWSWSVGDNFVGAFEVVDGLNGYTSRNLIGSAGTTLDSANTQDLGMCWLE